MEHIGIDLGGRESQICIRDDNGEIVLERRLATPDVGKHLASRKPGGRVVLESSAESFAVADWARAAGHQVRVVPASLVRLLGVGDRSLKNDRRDARKLSETDCRIEVPSVHIPSQMSREKQARAVARDAMVKARTKLINTVRSYLRTLAMPPVRAVPTTLPANVRRVLDSQPAGIPDFVEHLLCAIEGLNEQIGQAELALKQVAQSDPVCANLQSMPGVGPVTAVCFAAAIDDVSRFDSAAALTSYLGLVPGEDTTGFKTKRTGITKAGSSRVRWTLNQAAWTLVRTQKGTPLECWYQQVAARRGKKVAICALARKMAAILFAMWRDQKPYNPKLAAAETTNQADA